MKDLRTIKGNIHKDDLPSPIGYKFCSCSV